MRALPAAGPEVDLDLDLGRREPSRRRAGARRVRRTLPSRNTVTPASRTDARGRRSRHAAGADRLEDAPPVGVAAEERRLDQHRVGDAARGAPRLAFAAAAAHHDVDELGGALAVARQRARRARSPPRASAPAKAGARRAARRRAAAGCPRAPLASSSTVSLVEHSPSTLTRLKVASADLAQRDAQDRRARRRRRRAGSRTSWRGRARSCPSPSRCRRRVTARPADPRARRCAHFGTVSVVMIARAASRKPSGASARSRVARRRAGSSPAAAAGRSRRSTRPAPARAARAERARGRGRHRRRVAPPALAHRDVRARRCSRRSRARAPRAARAATTRPARPPRSSA